MRLQLLLSPGREGGGHHRAGQLAYGSRHPQQFTQFPEFRELLDAAFHRGLVALNGTQATVQNLVVVLLFAVAIVNWYCHLLTTLPQAATRRRRNISSDRYIVAGPKKSQIPFPVTSCQC
jgi:hypothetical protein